ncbi:MAG: Ig-like domain-containing protein [Xenococcus sp. MO_188.B8]|nr:Ig-like domain-containing protein [Xenococcus sp. MO_188.B8]
MYDPIEITRLLVFGTSNPSPDDYNAHIRPAGATPASITYNMLDYMTNGGGRFAYPSLFGAVEKFFDSSIVIPDKDYTPTEITNLLGLSNDDLTIGISQYGTGIAFADHVERSYIFGTTNFRLDISNATFKVSNGIRTIENMEVRAFDDNFDFNGGNQLANLVNSLLLEPTFDPYGLGRGAVEINFTGSGKQYAVYDQANFDIDTFNELIVSDTSEPIERAAKDAAGIAALSVTGGIPYFSNITDDPFLSFKRGDFKVIYGTPGNDNLNPLDAELSFDIYFEYLMVGGDGNDVIEGGDFADEILGGTGVDTLLGAGANDTLIGGNGNDEIDGEQGDDTAIYRGAFADYDIEFLADDSIKIIDNTTGRDDTDTLKSVERAIFSDRSIDLSPGQDIAFVIDTTGSMGDDIAAVKARANDIINAIYDNALNSRIAVVGYNDPSTNTYLSFTDQPNIEDRKNAARNAINSVSTGGGGDFPEAVNAGLIRALNGGAGEWRSDASARRIILFGDAPPKDTALRSQVLSLAANVGVSVPSSPSTFASASTLSFSPLSISGDIETSRVSDGLAMTTFAIETLDADGSTITVPVEIFTILIGNDFTTRADFESLATATGGQAFAAANASEVVDALIKAIETPTVVNNAPVAVEDTFVTDEDISLSIDVLINDSDLDGDVLTISEVNGVSAEVGTELTLDSGASLTLNSDGTLSYDPGTAFAYLNGGETSTDSFNYTIDDGKEGIATATVTIDINGIDDAVNLQGTKKNDRLIGGNNHDYLDGDKGKDILEGGARDDTLIGGYGKDTLYGDEGNDYLDGGKDKDYLSGGLGDDTLIGGHGKDTLYGGEGNDVLNGGKDKDVFVLMSEGMTDTIEDFENKKDSLGLSDGLTFEQLTIGQADNNTVISITDSGEVLAILANVESDLIDSKDFTYKF